jgi:hypothetical protein
MLILCKCHQVMTFISTVWLFEIFMVYFSVVYRRLQNLGLITLVIVFHRIREWLRDTVGGAK